MHSSPVETQKVSNIMKDDIPTAHDDYETGLTSLWRKDTNFLDRRIIIIMVTLIFILLSMKDIISF